VSQACKFEEEYCIDLNQVLPIIAGQKQFDRIGRSPYFYRKVVTKGGVFLHKLLTLLPEK
jgi:hypothetical protein